MRRDDQDDILTGVVPGPDDEPTAAERAHARTFAELVDKTMAGRTPPAMSADDRALLEVATVIRAASGDVELPPARRRSVIEDALRQGVAPREAAVDSVTPIGPRRRIRRWAPWLVAGTSALVAAAAVLLWLRAPVRVVPGRPATAALPTTQRSRPADALVGPISRDRAGDASARLDVIFADRLDGYRELRFGEGRVR